MFSAPILGVYSEWKLFNPPPQVKGSHCVTTASECACVCSVTGAPAGFAAYRALFTISAPLLSLYMFVHSCWFPVGPAALRQPFTASDPQRDAPMGGGAVFPNASIHLYRLRCVHTCWYDWSRSVFQTHSHTHAHTHTQTHIHTRTDALPLCKSCSASLPIWSIRNWSLSLPKKQLCPRW